MRWMIENINLRCIFYFILFYFVFDTALEKWKSKISLRKFFVPPNFIPQVNGKRYINEKLNSTTSWIQRIFLQECLNFLDPWIL